MWQRAADPTTALSMLCPVERALHQRAWRANASFDAHSLAGVELLAVACDELGLVVEQIALARALPSVQMAAAW